jgi:hypothetical protein
MKIYHYMAMLLACFMTVSLQAQTSGADSTGLPGDNFNLQGALAMFKKASSPEDFEKLLNSQDNHVNNLDLNNDGDIDYIRVIDKSGKDVHAFVLQALISDRESQDIAVVELEKTGDTLAIVQIVGDEDIYGEQVIIEPGDEADEDAFIQSHKDQRMARGPNAAVWIMDPRIVVNVWSWPAVRFVYAPIYRPWVSPWRWRHYPGWWGPWRPVAWRVWHPFHRPYYSQFAIVRTHRVTRAHRIYTPHRVTSLTVRTRHASVVGNYRVTRTKTSVSGPRGHGATKTKTTVTGPRGNSRSKTKVRRH